ncbi:MAG: hypothetical protein ACRERS_07745, partial [Methylococcales bacterium]
SLANCVVPDSRGYLRTHPINVEWQSALDYASPGGDLIIDLDAAGQNTLSVFGIQRVFRATKAKHSE